MLEEMHKSTEGSSSSEIIGFLDQSKSLGSEHPILYKKLLEYRFWNSFLYINVVSGKDSCVAVNSEKLVDFQRTAQRYIPKNRTLRNHRRESFNSYKSSATCRPTVRKRANKHVSVEVDSWKPAR
jgi:hypothetical protein